MNLNYNPCKIKFSSSSSSSSSLSLSPCLYTLLLFERFALLLPLLTYCVFDLGLHLLFLLPLFIITVLGGQCFCVYLYAILSFEYFIVHLVSEPYFSSSSLFFHGRRVLALILKIIIPPFIFYFIFSSSSPPTLSSFSSLLR